MSKAWKKDSDKLRDFISKKKEEMGDGNVIEEEDDNEASMEIPEDDKKYLFIAGCNPMKNDSKIRENDGFSVTEQGGSERYIDNVQNQLQSQIHIKDAGNIRMQESSENVGGNFNKEQSKKTVIIKNDSVMRNDSVMTNAMSQDPMRIDEEGNLNGSHIMQETKVPPKSRFSTEQELDKQDSVASKPPKKEAEGPCWDLGNQDIELTNSMINHQALNKTKDLTQDPSKALANDSWKADDEEVGLSNSFDH